MDRSEGIAIGTICLMAAFADGCKAADEQDKIKEFFGNLGISEQASIMQKVLLKQTTVEQEAAELKSPETKNLAYEMAVFICESDNALNDQEKEFLDKLKSSLGIAEQAAEQVHAKSEIISQSPIDSSEGQTADAAQPGQENAQPTGENSAAQNAEQIGAEVDSSIIKNSMLCAGLELVPDSISTIAIIPLQMRMVYNIGKKYGYTLDRGHIKEFIAAFGIGMTSQVVEGFTRKVFGSLVRMVGGKMVGGIAKEGASIAMTFATTYALGRISKIYYSSGRKISLSELKPQFQKEVAEAKEQYGKYSSQIAENAKKISPSAIMDMIRGKNAVP